MQLTHFPSDVLANQSIGGVIQATNKGSIKLADGEVMMEHNEMGESVINH